MCFRRLAAVAISLISLALLAGCGGAPPRQQRARVEVVLLAGGGARVDLYAAGRLRSDADVRALARRIAGALFPGAEGIRVRTEKDRGAPFARAEIDRAYRTGRRPFLRIDTSGAARELVARGFDDTAMKLRLPPVPATVRPDISGNHLWHLREGAPAPVLRIGMRPEPARWAGVMALPLLGALGVALAFFVRRRALAAPAAGLAVAAALLALPLGAGRRGADLGVAGLLGGTALDVASAAPLTALPLGMPAAMLLGAMTVRSLRGPAVRNGNEAPPRDTGVFW
ncbi:hypothetical protein GCM10010402_36880 [Actinomadura luteofluorescens]|uniref:hypothetical protein n=1 Tax=Actinomadura luteofluorescens TaxID=46163 RepID=UPI002164921F|nr:hypothetical protein [Actinomadura glauciflava]MCR3738882.1 hypothetical protein [Actinomadura glauciflava]